VNLNPPRRVTWWIAILLAIVGVLAELIALPVLSNVAFWLVVAAFVLLAAGTVARGL
jgi:heme/copper-type cytochrome/quinol oxidase subunit 1